MLYVAGVLILPAIFPDWLAPFRVLPVTQAVAIVMHADHGVVFGLACRRLAGW